MARVAGVGNGAMFAGASGYCVAKVVPRSVIRGQCSGHGNTSARDGTREHHIPATTVSILDESGCL